MSLLTDLIAHWKLNEASGTRNDSHGTNHLTDNNTVTSATGKIGDAADFEAGNSEYLSIADNASLSLGSDTDFTWAGWIKLESLPSGGLSYGVFSKRTAAASATEYSLFLIEPSNTFRFDVGNGSSSASVSSGAMSAGTWYFVVCWHSSTDNKIYIQINNGTPTETAWSGGTQNTASELHIGKVPNASSAYFDGLVDSLSFWKRVLTSDERTALYNSGNGLDYESFAPSGTEQNLAGAISTGATTTGALSIGWNLVGAVNASADVSGTLTGGSEASTIIRSGRIWQGIGIGL